MATNGLNKITDRILSAAQESAQRILAAAQADCDRITAEYTAKAEEIDRANRQNAAQKAADLLARADSAAAMQGRNLVGARRSEMIEEVFGSAFASVENRTRDAYAELVAGLLASAVAELAETEEKNYALYGEADESANAAYEVILNEADRAELGETVIARAKEKLQGTVSAERLEKLTLAATAANIKGGVILRYGDVESNCSLEMLFSLLRRELEGDVSRALFRSDAN